jgi:hypothetical protein
MNDLQPPEVTQGWLERARSDLTLGKIALKTEGVLPKNVTPDINFYRNVIHHA